MATHRAEDWQIYDQAGRRKYLTASELARFLAAANDCAPPMRALCYVLAHTGCRISEALALTAEHLDRDSLRLTFKTLKRRRQVFRSIPVPAVTVGLLSSLPPIAGGRLWSMHRATAWRGVKAAMKRAEIIGLTASPQGPAACVQHADRRPRYSHQPDPTLDGTTPRR